VLSAIHAAAARDGLDLLALLANLLVEDGVAEVDVATYACVRVILRVIAVRDREGIIGGRYPFRRINLLRGWVNKGKRGPRRSSLGPLPD